MAIDDPHNIVPPLSDDEYEDLKDTIKKHRVLVPIYRDEAGQRLDGKYREKIYHELGITDYPVVVVEGLTADEKLELSLKLNLVRRHLKRDALQPIAVQLRQQGWALERIAKALGVGTSTVHRWLDDVSRMENVTAAAVSTDTRGRQQPARKPRTPDAKKAAKMATTEAASPVPEVSHTPGPLPVSTDSQTRLDQQASEEPTAPDQAPAEPLVHQAVNEVGKRLQIQIELLHRVLHHQQVEGNLPALAHAWPANESPLPPPVRRPHGRLGGTARGLGRGDRRRKPRCRGGHRVSAG